MRRIQPSKQGIHRLYLKKRAEFLRQNDVCQAKVPGVCQYWASDVHHRAGNVGHLLIDEDKFMAVCRLCHGWIGRNVGEARKKEWIIYL